MLKRRHQSHLLLREVRPRLSEKRIPIGLQKIHQQIGHRDNRTLVRLLKQRGTHPWVLKMAHDHRCSSCEESKPPALRHITSSYENVPGAHSGDRWNTLATPCDWSSCSDVSLWLMLGFTCSEETRERSYRNNQTAECKEIFAQRLVCSSWKTPAHQNGSRWLLHEQRDAQTRCIMILDSTRKSYLEKRHGSCLSLVSS